jgi:uncharacterized protein (DUF305 family)
MPILPRKYRPTRCATLHPVVGTANTEMRWRQGVLACTAAVVPAGCGGGSDKAPAGGEVETSYVQPGAPGEPSRSVSADELADLGSAEHTQADVDFMRGMIHHHAQALVMTSLVRDRSASRDIPLLARRMEISQESEIEVMERWLEARGVEPPDEDDHLHDHGGGGSLMPGMVSSRRLEELADAGGRAFDRRFLRYMVRHHRGALTMVRDLRATDGGGVEPEIDAFVRHVESDQAIEIERMNELRAVLERRPLRAAARRARPSRAETDRATRFAFAGGKPRICVIVTPSG